MKKRLILLCPVMLLLSTFFMTGCSQKTKTVTCPNNTQHTSTARYKATMRSYRVLGKYYAPHLVNVGEKMYGISSWYGPDFHGKCTSNGEKYNMYARTAAHKTLPMDTIVRVRNLQNGKSTVVRINDRGPFVKGRIIDCSYKAGKELGLDKMGIARVEVEVLGARNSKTTKSIITPKPKKLFPSRGSQTIGIQIGAFSNIEGAKKLKQHYENKYEVYHPVIRKGHTVSGNNIYRVILLGFKSQDEANRFKENIVTMI